MCQSAPLSRDRATNALRPRPVGTARAPPGPQFPAPEGSPLLRVAKTAHESTSRRKLDACRSGKKKKERQSKDAFFKAKNGVYASISGNSPARGGSRMGQDGPHASGKNCSHPISYADIVALVKTSPSPKLGDQRPPAESREWQRGKVAATSNRKRSKVNDPPRDALLVPHTMRKWTGGDTEAAQWRHRNAQMTTKDLGSVPPAIRREIDM